MIEIYHNPRCSKSREGCQILNQLKKEYKIIEYLKEPLSQDEIKSLIQKLGIHPMDLVRTKEEIWKKNYKNKTMSDEEIIQALEAHPKLIERPIVVKGSKAIIGRPPTLIIDFLQ